MVTLVSDIGTCQATDGSATTVQLNLNEERERKKGVFAPKGEESYPGISSTRERNAHCSSCKVGSVLYRQRERDEGTHVWVDRDINLTRLPPAYHIYTFLRATKFFKTLRYTVHERERDESNRKSTWLSQILSLSDS